MTVRFKCGPPHDPSAIAFILGGTPRPTPIVRSIIKTVETPRIFIRFVRSIRRTLSEPAEPKNLEQVRWASLGQSWHPHGWNDLDDHDAKIVMCLRKRLDRVVLSRIPSLESFISHGPTRWRYSVEEMKAFTISALMKLPLN